MKNINSPKGIMIAYIIRIAMVLTMVAGALMESLALRASMEAVALTTMATIWLVSKRRSFCDAAMASVMKIKGLQCRMEGEDILVKKGKIVLKAKVINRPEKGSKRVHFMFEFVPDMLKNIQPEGWALLVSECNAHYDYTTMRYFGDHMCCQVETTVKNPKDFIREYMFAYNKIGETIQGFEGNMEYVAKKYPVREHRIGFVSSKL